MKGEKNCYFLIKVCSVCFSITQHMSDQHHWWAHQTKKCLRLAPPFAWTVICCRTPSPHVWIVNLNLVPNPHLSRKSFPSTLPRFSSASSLIFICFFMFTPGGRSLTPQACLSVNSAERTLPCSWELQMYVFKAEGAILILLLFFASISRFCQLVRSWKRALSRREAVSLNLPISYFLSLFVFDSSSSAELPRTAETKWKLSCCH